MLAHGQNFEDVLLWRVLRHVEKGNYLDIGAQDPVADSVSRLFYEAGWRGVHVEPTPAYAAKLRLDRPDETVIEVALSEKPGLVTLYEIPDTGLTTGVPDIADRHRCAGISSHEITVPCLTLEMIFQQVGDNDIHWMKVDVEGMEREVLAGWGNAAQRPWVLVIESTLPNSPEPNHHQWIDLVLERNYQEAYFDGLSRYFVAAERADLLPAFAIPVNVFDGFNIGVEHYLCGEIRRQQRIQDEASREEFETAHSALLQAQAEQESREREWAAQLEAERTQWQQMSNQLQAEHEAREKALTARLASERAQLQQMSHQMASTRDTVSRIAEHLSAAEQARASALQNMAPMDRSLRGFLECGDHEFLVAAYREFLGRDPDEAGRLFYAARLKEGVGRFDILSNLRFSPEGRSHRRTGSSLDRLLRLYRWKKKLSFRS